MDVTSNIATTIGSSADHIGQSCTSSMVSSPTIRKGKFKVSKPSSMHNLNPDDSHQLLADQIYSVKNLKQMEKAQDQSFRQLKSRHWRTRPIPHKRLKRHPSTKNFASESSQQLNDPIKDVPLSNRSDYGPTRQARTLGQILLESCSSSN